MKKKIVVMQVPSSPIKAPIQTPVQAPVSPLFSPLVAPNNQPTTAAIVVVTQRDVEDQKEEIRTLLVREAELHGQIKNLEKEVSAHKKEIKARDLAINEKEKKIFELKKKNQELDKFKFVLDFKIRELKQQVCVCLWRVVHGVAAAFFLFPRSRPFRRHVCVCVLRWSLGSRRSPACGTTSRRWTTSSRASTRATPRWTTPSAPSGNAPTDPPPPCLHSLNITTVPYRSL